MEHCVVDVIDVPDVSLREHACICTRILQERGSYDEHELSSVHAKCAALSWEYVEKDVAVLVRISNNLQRRLRRMRRVSL
eukprot:2992922-Amphidinium_carterae.2